MSRLLIATAAAALLFGTGSADAHEFWIHPSAFRAQVNTPIRITLLHGERFLGDVVPRNDAMIDQFVLSGPESVQRVLGMSGMQSSFAKPAETGLHLITYRSRRYESNLDALAFEAYLEEEGLGEIARRRAARGESDTPGCEVYSRCAKALLLVGDEGAEGYDRRAGLTLEIVPQQNPYAAKRPDEMSFEVLFETQPLPGARVVAVNQADPEALFIAETDESGIATFDMSQAGAWMVTVLHMIEAPQGVEADWESFWSSITFEIPERTDQASSLRPRLGSGK